MILTNAPGATNSETWASSCRVLKGDERGPFGPLRSAVTLFLEAGRRRYACVVLQGNQFADWLYAILRLIHFRYRPPTAKLDCLWSKPSSRFLYWLKRWQRRLEAHSIDRYYVYARREIAAFSATFGIPPEKFRFIPYHHTLNWLTPTIRDEGYLFSGGSSGRDYALLFEAVESLDYRVEVACRDKKAMEGLSIPANVQIRSYSHENYIAKMAGCRINIVPVHTGRLRSFGHQTFLNSMALGKCTIVTDPAGACDYIQHGSNGVLTPAGDADRLRSEIARLMEEHPTRRLMEDKARLVRKSHSTEVFFANLVQMLKEDFESKGLPREERGRAFELFS